MKPAPFEYQRPETLEEAVALLAGNGDGARLLAGGQSLGPMLNLRLALPTHVVDISRLGELRSIEASDGGVRVGAGVCHADFEDGRVPDVAAGLLRRTAAEIAYRAIRNRGTIGGSVAHADPAADWPATLIALGASAGVRGTDGIRETRIGDLIVDSLTTSLGPAEVIESIFIPRLPTAAKWGRCKINIMPGHFADALSIVVRGGAERPATVVLSGRVLPPVTLSRTETLLDAADRFSDELAEALRGAVEEDLRAGPDPAAIGEDDADLYKVAVVRAAKEAWS